MSISGIPSTSYNPYQTGAANPLQQQFQQLGQALQSSNLSAAQSDFASLQAAFAQPSSATGASSSTAGSSPASQTFNQLASDLQSGNLSGAQKDYSTLQQETKLPIGEASFHPTRGSHWPGGGRNSPLQALNTAGQNPAPGNLDAAQQTYATLQQALQQSALGGAALNPESLVSFDA